MSFPLNLNLFFCHCWCHWFLTECGRGFHETTSWWELRVGLTGLCLYLDGKHYLWLMNLDQISHGEISYGTGEKRREPTWCYAKVTFRQIGLVPMMLVPPGCSSPPLGRQTGLGKHLVRACHNNWLIIEVGRGSDSRSRALHAAHPRTIMSKTRLKTY